MASRGVINGKAGKAAALPKFSETLTLSQLGRADYAPPLALPYLKFIVITPLRTNSTANVCPGLAHLRF